MALNAIRRKDGPEFKVPRHNPGFGGCVIINFVSARYLKTPARKIVKNPYPSPR